MVQFLLSRTRISRWCVISALFAVVSVTPMWAAGRAKQTPTEIKVPDLLLDGGRTVKFERVFSNDRQVTIKKGFWTKAFDFVVGQPDLHFLVRPYSIVSDSRGRIIISDPGAVGVHIFDFGQQKYKFLSRRDKGKDPMLAPQCVAVDDKDNIYVTDSEAGKIFVYDANGKYQRAIGSLKGGEGFFKRPTGIAVDSPGQRIYVTDTLRNQIFMLDMQGSVLAKFGKTGSAKGEFNYPTELRLDGPNLIVVDAMNFRVQVLDRSGVFQYAIGQVGDAPGDMFRPKGIAIDSEDHLYVVDGQRHQVQVFDQSGQLLYYFGNGSGFGEFQMPAGLFIDSNDRIYVVDSYNRRVQVFHYYGIKQAKGGLQ